MYDNKSLNVNDRGHLAIGGCDTVELAAKYGTPLYVVDEGKVESVCNEFLNSFKKYYSGKGMPMYASKALCCKELCRIMKRLGMGLDVVSGGELYTALSVDFPADKIHFHGNNKTYDEIEYAIKSGVGKIVIDNENELAIIENICAKLDTRVSVSIRITPGIDAHTHNFIKTGQIDCKFGFAIENGEAYRIIEETLKCPHIDLKEFHCHIGSQIFDIDPFVHAAEVMMDFIKDIRDKYGVTVAELNLGGGFGIKYVDTDNPTDYDNYIAEVSKAIISRAKQYDLPVPYIYIEPGRSIVGEAGITLYTVGGIKNIPNVRTYVSIDGGIGDNIRYAMYQSDYTAVVANKADKTAESVVTIAGKCCESGDLIQENTKIQDVQIGDILAVLSTGAYNYSMSSNYNRLPRPAMVMVKDGVDRLIIKRETYEDILRNDI
ncbi:MAG: diaminopimelate decarboxylase [Acutalibacteraceae bacterium]